tara:strand:+ start:4180 stop:5742 length:1563 start_codon:yes stop_codon:yes gene_type:complete
MKIGLVEQEYGFERILNQEKVPWETVNLDRNLKDYTLLILNSMNLSSSQATKIKSYVAKGGALLTDSLSLSKLFRNKKISKSYIKSVKGKGPLFRNIGFLNIEKEGYRIKGSTPSGIYLSRFKKGFVIALPFDVNSLMLDERSRKIYFPSSSVPLKEGASLVSKGNLRRLVVNCFVYLHLIRKIPYIHLWYYPKGYETIFCYRVDLDILNRNELDNILKVVKENGINLTWFLSVINNENHEDDVIKLCKSNQSVQSHSYEHEVFPFFEENYQNLLKSNQFISKYTKSPVGFASPFGFWNKNLGRALEKVGYLYSSEFSLSYDDMPFYPFLYSRKSKVIQLPIYPVCVGSLRMRLYSSNKMKKYFDYMISMQYRKQMPLFLYDHPNDGIGEYPEVLDFILKKVKKLEKVLVTDFGEFSKWWKEREKKKFRIFLEKDKLKLVTNNKNKKFCLRIIFPGYKESKVPLNKGIVSFSDLKLKQIPSFREKISFFDVLKSKISFSLFYLVVLVKAIKRRIYRILNI